MNTSEKLLRTMERTVNVTGSFAATGLTPSKVNEQSIAKAKATAINMELEAFIHWCYAKDEKGRFANLYGGTQITGKNRCPWGSSDKPMKLTKKDRWIMRHWLLSFGGERPTPVFFYIPSHRRWYVNTVSWDSLELALQWGTAHQITAEKYREWENVWSNR